MNFKTPFVLFYFAYILNTVYAHYYIIESITLQDKNFPALDLGGGNNFKNNMKDLYDNPVLNQWEDKEQFDGFGTAQSLLLLLKHKYPSLTFPLIPGQVKILFVGGFGGNSLGGWVAATILCNLGIQCDLYVIRDECSGIRPTASSASAKSLLNLIANNGGLFPNITIFNSHKLNQSLEDEFDSLVKLKSDYNEKKQGATENLKSWIRSAEDQMHLSFIRAIESQYYLVFDGICGPFPSDELRIGTLLGLTVLKFAEHVNEHNILVSADVPSFWSSVRKEIPLCYQTFGIQPLMPLAVIHIGAMKPFALTNDCENMLHLVVIPKRLEDFTDSLTVSHKYWSDLKPNLQAVPFRPMLWTARIKVVNVIVDISQQIIDMVKANKYHRINRFQMYASFFTITHPLRWEAEHLFHSVC